MVFRNPDCAGTHKGYTLTRSPAEGKMDCFPCLGSRGKGQVECRV